jgi:arylsulfatase
LQAWPRDIEKYRGKYSEGYGAIRSARYKKMVGLGIADPAMKLSVPTFSAWDALSEEEREKEEARMEVYAAMIDCVDQNIGRLLVKLEEMGKLDNTLVFFASDNGSSAEFAERGVGGTGEIGSISYWASLGENWANVSNTPFRLYKSDSYEGGICTPFIAYWPGKIKNPGSIDHRPLHFIDFMPTLVELSGATYPAQFRGQEIVPMQGESFLSVLLGAEAVDREKPLFWTWSRGRAVRLGKWKAVANGSEWALYDMEADRNETTDLKDQFPETFTELRDIYDAWEKSAGAKSKRGGTPTSKKKTGKRNATKK